MQAEEKRKNSVFLLPFGVGGESTRSEFLLFATTDFDKIIS